MLECEAHFGEHSLGIRQLLQGGLCDSCLGDVQDALDEIARQKPRDLFKPLRVHFIGEEGIDAGGVKKEFFQLLVTELLSPDYGMLIFQPVCLSLIWASQCDRLLMIVLCCQFVKGGIYWTGARFPVGVVLYKLSSSKR